MDEGTKGGIERGIADGLIKTIMISIVQTSVVNIPRMIRLVKISTEAALPWRRVASASQHLV